MKRARRRFRHWYWILPTILLTGTVLLLLAMIARWLEGGEFHSLVEHQTTERLHANTELSPIRWRWTELSSDSLHALGTAETALKKVASSGLHAKLHPEGLLQGRLVVQEITLDRIEIQVGPVTEVKTETVCAVTPQHSSLPKWLPAQFEIRKIRSSSADVLIEQPKGGSFDILGARLESIPDGNQVRFEARGGRLVCERFPGLNIGIDMIRCRLSGEGLDLTGADLTFHSGGNLRVEGNFPSNGSESRLKGHWERVDIASLLPALDGKVLGTFEGRGEAACGRDGIHTISGDVSAHDVTLSRIPALDQLALFTGIDQLRHLPIQEAHATFSGDARKTVWRDVVLESKGLLKLTGDAEVGQEGILKGSFQVGITKGIVDMIPLAREVLALNEHDGYIWTPMLVEGSLSHPREDLSPRLATLLAAKAEGLVKEGIQEGLKILGIKSPAEGSTSNALSTNATKAPAHPGTPSPLNLGTNAVKDVEQGAGKVLDALGGFLK